MFYIKASFSKEFLAHQYEKLMFWYQWLHLCVIYRFIFVLCSKIPPKSLKISFEFPLQVVLIQYHKYNMAFS